MESRNTLSDRGAPDGLPLVATFLVNETPALEELLRGLAETSAEGGHARDEATDGGPQYMVYVYRREAKQAPGKAGLRRRQPLTPREREVLHCVRRGLPTNEIGAELVISRYTVKAHLRAIYAKLHAHNRAAALMRAFMSGELRIGE